jgi:hypothetical protein
MKNDLGVDFSKHYARRAKLAGEREEKSENVSLWCPGSKLQITPMDIRTATAISANRNSTIPELLYACCRIPPFSA